MESQIYIKKLNDIQIIRNLVDYRLPYIHKCVMSHVILMKIIQFSH